MLHEDEIVETLIELYHSVEEKRKGAYKLDKEAFKSIAGRKHIRGDLLINLDIALWHEGYRLLNFMDSEGYVFLVKGSALAKQLQSLPDEMLEEYTYDGESW